MMTEEQRLRANLFTLAAAYCEHTGTAITAVGKAISGATQFFKRLEDTETSFRVRSYDEAAAWFSENWPTRLAWPKGITRPPRAANIQEKTSGGQGNRAEAAE